MASATQRYPTSHGNWIIGTKICPVIGDAFMAITEEAFVAATRRATARVNQTPGAIKTYFDHETARVVIELNTGLILTFRPQDVEGLAGALPQALEVIEVSPSGLGIYFPELEVDFYLPSLLEGFLGSKQWMAAQMGKAGGKATSAAKAAAARANGKLGGRPRKPKVAASPA
jgi:hypothetical protein